MPGEGKGKGPESFLEEVTKLRLEREQDFAR